jgi:hypothetical protein
LKLTEWLTHFNIRKKSQTNEQISNTPIFLEKYPWLSRLFILLPLIVYIITRGIVYQFLLCLEYLLVKLYYLLPDIVEFMQRIFKMFAFWVVGVRSMIGLFLNPMWDSIIYPCFEMVATHSIKFSLDLSIYVVKISPDIITIIKSYVSFVTIKATTKLQLAVRMFYCINEEYIQPFLVKCQEIFLVLWPYLNHIIFTFIQGSIIIFKISL